MQKAREQVSPPLVVVSEPPKTGGGEALTPGAAQFYSAVVNPQPTAVVIHCSDPRFQTAFREFIETELGLSDGQYIPFVIAGGAGVLSRPEALPKEFRFMRERLELFREHFKSIRRVILINHEDCAYYHSLCEKSWALRTLAHLLPRDDMKLIAQVFHRLLSHLGMQVELYHAKFSDDERTRIVFERIEQ
ncbi:MAG: hypothetical protein WC845_02785 [Candidatus Staskawiczbacteria bacterium]|jgi:hypothetical protein